MRKYVYIATYAIVIIKKYAYCSLLFLRRQFVLFRDINKKFLTSEYTKLLSLVCISFTKFNLYFHLYFIHYTLSKIILVYLKKLCWENAETPVIAGVH